MIPLNESNDRLYAKSNCIISPTKPAREGWRESIDGTLKTRGAEPLDQNWLNALLSTDDDRSW